MMLNELKRQKFSHFYNMYKKKFKAIVFDYGGVIELAPPESRGLFEGITTLTGITVHDFRTLYFKRNHLNNIHNQSQKETFLSVVKELSQDADAISQVAAFIDSFEAGKVLNTELIDLIQKLRTLGSRAPSSSSSWTTSSSARSSP